MDHFLPNLSGEKALGGLVIIAAGLVAYALFRFFFRQKAEKG